jgi:hypothetical protein
VSKRGDKRRRRERRRRTGADERGHEERTEGARSEEPALTDEETRYGREQMRQWVAARPERLEQIKTQLAELFAPYDAFDVLATLWFENAVINPETYQESSFEGLAAITEFAAYVLLQRDRRDATSADASEPPSGDVIESATGLIREALFAATFVRHHELSGSNPAELGPVRSDFAGQRMFIRGTSYDWQEAATVRSLFGEPVINQAISESLGFDAKDGLALAERSTQLALERLAAKRTLALEYEADVLSKLDRYRRTGDADPEAEPLLSSLAQLNVEGARKSVQSLAVRWVFDDLGRLSAIRPADLAESAGVSAQAATSFLERFSTQFGALPVAEPGWEIELVRNSPIVSDGAGNYLPFAAYHLLYGLRPAFEEVLKQEPRAWARYERHKAQLVEDEALAAIRAIGAPRIDLASVKYQLSDGPDTYELDGLVVFDSVAFFVEVKAGSLHASAQRGAPARLRRQLQDNVVTAAEQAKRAREALTTGTARNVRDQRGQPIELDLRNISHLMSS